MCNIAGYVGNRPAAPILLEMIRRQEGFAGGYYTGIATVCDGKIFYAKLTGDTRRLTSLTEAAKLPGTVGIVHSRSKSGGGDSWAHPFLSYKDGLPLSAYVANGTMGFAKPRSAEYAKKAEELMAAGYEMSSKVMEDNPRYQKLSDGSTVHMSDVMCQLIQRNSDGGDSPVAAMERAFCEMPSEIVGLLLNLSCPDRIVFSRINYPMHVAFASHGAFLSSTPTAFPEECGDWTLLSACSSGEIFANRFTETPYQTNPVTVAPMDAAVQERAFETVAGMLKNPVSISDLSKAVSPLFAEADCNPTAALVYEILDSLNRRGKLCTEIRQVEGAQEGLTAPKNYFSLRNQ